MKNTHKISLLVSVFILAIIGYSQYDNIFKSEEEQLQEEIAVTKEEVHDGEFDLAGLKKEGKPIIIDFTAEWCVPCRTFNPLLEKVKRDLGDEVIIKIVDVDKYPEIASAYPLTVIPTQLMISASGKEYQPINNSGIFGFTSYTNDVDNITLHQGVLEEAQLLAVIKEMKEQ